MTIPSFVANCQFLDGPGCGKRDGSQAIKKEDLLGTSK